MVPKITERITAGIFFIREIELIPIVIAQAPKTKLRFVLKESVSRGPIKEPAIPPMITPRQFAITPIGVSILLFNSNLGDRLTDEPRRLNNP